MSCVYYLYLTCYDKQVQNKHKFIESKQTFNH